MKSKVLIGLSAAVMALAMTASSALAYTTGPGTGGTAPPPTTNPNGTATTTGNFTFKDANGNPIAGLTVTFKTNAGNSSCVSFNPPTAVTNSAGVATTTVTFTCGGTFTLAALGAGGETATLTVSTGSAFPNTSATPAPSPALPIAGIALGLLLIAGAIVGLTRGRKTLTGAAA